MDDRSPPEIISVARDALEIAQAILKNILHSPAYTVSIKYSTYLSRVDLAFAALLCVRFSARFPALASESLCSDVSRLADLLAECTGATRLATLLR